MNALLITAALQKVSPHLADSVRYRKCIQLIIPIKHYKNQVADLKDEIN